MLNKKAELQGIFPFVLLLFPFLSIVFSVGFFHESNWSFFGLWLVAGTTLLSNHGSIKFGFLPAAFFTMALLSILGTFQNGLLSLVGINEIREGTLTFFSIAIILTTVRYEHPIPVWLFPFLYSLVTVIGFWGWKYLGWKTYVFLDISAFSTLASLPLYMRFRTMINEQHKKFYDAFYIALFLYLMHHADNSAAILACMCAAIFIFLLPIAKKYLKFLPKNDGFYIVGGLIFIALLVLISWKFFHDLPLQLQSRTLLGIVTVLQYFDDFTFSKFMHILFGYGWGSFQEFPVLNLFSIKNFSVYSNGTYNPNWEFLERNLLHSHNFIIETMVSSGLVGTSILLTFIYKFIQNIKDNNWADRFFIVSYLILLSAWFQTPPVLIFCIFAMAAIKEKTVYTINLSRTVSCSLGTVLIFFACTEFWTSYSLSKYRFSDIKIFESDSIAFINDPAHAYEKFSTYKSSNMAIGQAVFKLNETKSASVEIEKGVENLVEDYMNSYQKRNVASSVQIINLCNALVMLDGATYNVNSKFFQLFKHTVQEHLLRFPQRVDMAIGFMNFCFNKLQNIIELESMADSALKASPNHPVGLWFKAIAQLSKGHDKKQAIEKMKTAISGGLARFMPIDDEILKGLGIQK